ncbi:MAG: outer membrane protein assembly factor BamE [Rhodocyclaceae bacterium]
MKAKMILAAMALSLSACASLVSGGFSELKPGVASTADVEARVGKPAHVWKDADGGQQWEFSAQPQRQTTYMVHFSSDGKVLAVDQVLTRDQFVKVQRGMTLDQVRRLMGAPGSITQSLKGEDTWEWVVEDFMPDLRQRFYAYFRGGRITRTDVMVYEEN